MTLIDRITTEHYVEAAVALDTFDLIAARVRRLVMSGRRMSMTRRFTHSSHAPDLFVGLTLDSEARGGGLIEGGNGDGKFLDVLLAPGLRGFGLGAYASDGNGSEDEVWKRYRAAEGAEDVLAKRRNMTIVQLSGGREQDGPGRDDQIVIRVWNEHAVCEEIVVGFDQGGGR